MPPGGGAESHAPTAKAPVKGLDDHLAPSRLSAGAMAQKRRRRQQQQSLQNKKRKGTKRLHDDYDDESDQSIFKDPVREEILKNQQEIDELRAKQKKLRLKIHSNNFAPDDDYQLTTQDVFTYRATKAKQRQVDSLRREEKLQNKRELQLQEQRQIRHNLEAAKSFQQQTGRHGILPAPFFFTPHERKTARQTYIKAKRSIFGPAGPLEGKSFSIRSFELARQSQLKKISNYVPNDLIQMEIQRRMLVSFFAQNFNQLLPYGSNPILILSPIHSILRSLSRDPQKDLSRPSIFIKAAYNPYMEYYKQLLPIMERLLSQRLLQSQRSPKKIQREFQVIIDNLNTNIKLHFSLQSLRRSRLLRSRFRLVRKLAKQAWLYTPPNTDTMNSLKTTPIFFPNSLLRQTILKAVGYKSNQPPSPYLNQEDQARYWLDQIPIESTTINNNINSSHNQHLSTTASLSSSTTIPQRKKFKRPKHKLRKSFKQLSFRDFYYNKSFDDISFFLSPTETIIPLSSQFYQYAQPPQTSSPRILDHFFDIFKSITLSPLRSLPGEDPTLPPLLTNPFQSQSKLSQQSLSLLNTVSTQLSSLSSLPTNISSSFSLPTTVPAQLFNSLKTAPSL